MNAVSLLLICLGAPLGVSILGRLPVLSGRSLGILSSLLQLLAAIAGIGLIFLAPQSQAGTLWESTWLHSGTLSIQLGLDSSPEIFLMAGFVQLVAFLVFVYAGAYMEEDPGVRRFWSGIGLFTFSMNLMLVSTSTLQLFLGWELVGFASFLLIGHTHSDSMAGRAAGKAFLMNRIGDALMLAGILVLAAGSRTFSVNLTLEWLKSALVEQSYQQSTAIWGGALLLCGAISKSAQFPLQVWLPDAMKGPTPVSALMHAATLVAAGIWLLFRFHLIFNVEVIGTGAVCIGGLTFLIGGISALIQWDIKKILAYSTMGQLGLMVAGMGAGSGSGALLHLWIHGLFKCGLFLLAGILIHHHHHLAPEENPQDIRNLRIRGKGSWLIAMSFLILSASMAGLPGFAGLFGKEAIMNELFLWSAENPFHWIAFLSILLGNAFTGAYLLRLGWYLFRKGAGNTPPMHIPMGMLIPTVLLAIVNLWFFFGPIPLGSTWLDWVLQHTDHPPAWLFFSATGSVIAGAVISYFRCRYSKDAVSDSATSGQWHMGLDRLWSGPVLMTFKAFAEMISWIDHKVIDPLVCAAGKLFHPSVEPGNKNMLGSILAQSEQITDNISSGRKPLVSLSHLFSSIDRNITDALVNRIASQTRQAGRGMAGLQDRPLQRNMILALLLILAIASIITYFARMFSHG